MDINYIIHILDVAINVLEHISNLLKILIS